MSAGHTGGPHVPFCLDEARETMLFLLDGVRKVSLHSPYHRLASSGDREALQDLLDRAAVILANARIEAAPSQPAPAAPELVQTRPRAALRRVATGRA